MPSPLLERIQDVKTRITNAAARSGRKESDITLLAVTKTLEVSRIQEAYGAGLRDFGENRVQEGLEKIPQLPTDIRWHLIGQLQSNKINKVLGKFVLIHSVDSLELAQDISKRTTGGTQDILLEVNTSGEESKAGVKPEEAVETALKVAELSGIKLRGLMTVGPLTEDKDKQRESFRKLKELFEKVKSKRLDKGVFMILSMGMSSDYEMAVEEGSTLVRVGTALFGPRL